MSKLIVTAIPSVVELAPKPIPSEWILSGAPEARSNLIARSHDWTSSIVVWDCTAGRFTWHYCSDEVIMVVSGEAFLVNESGDERRFGPGDIGFFPAGTSVTWRVPRRIRKVAVLRETMWRPLGFVLKISKKLLRVIGLGEKSALIFTVVACGLLHCS